jgi:predicted Zn-dependent protease
MRRMAAAITLGVVAAGCAVNPVTGENELALISEAQEIRLGQQQYAPSRQMEGGDYTADPGLTAYVNAVGQRLAAVSDRPLPYEFVVLNNSVPNAWALPGGKIAVNRGLLLELDSEAELAAVLGHEIVHAAARHGAKAQERGLLMQGAILVAGIAASDSSYANAAVGAASVAAQLIHQKYGRSAELEADHYGMIYMARAGYDARAAISLQETFVRLSEGRNPGWLEGLFSSHPPSRARVEANRATAAALPPGGRLDEDRYMEEIQGLVETREAYAKSDQGRRMLAAGDQNGALALAEQALARFPREPTFHALRGDVRLAQKRYGAAIADYDRALALDDGFFYFYQQRGLAAQALGRPREAARDLEAGARLLPTAPAMNALGELSQASGDLDAAVMYYRAAAESDTPAGRQAARSLVRVDLPRTPGRYLSTRLTTDAGGRVFVEVANPTDLALRNVVVVIEYPEPDGRRQLRRRIDALPAGGTARVNPGLPPLADRRWLAQFRAGVVSASLER